MALAHTTTVTKGSTISTEEPPATVDVVADAPAESPSENEAPAPRKPRRAGWIVTIVLLVLALAATGVVLALTLTRLDEAQQEIEHQRDLIEEKQTFASAAEDLMATASGFDGVALGTIVPVRELKSLIQQGWAHRWNLDALGRDISDLHAANDELAAVRTAAVEQAATNATGTYLEAITDQLGGGFVTTSLENTDAVCERDVLGCVRSQEPLTVHYDAPGMTAEYWSDWLRQGVAYHEYAHVLQFANPVPTKIAEESFGGDWETMADCYALTSIPGWSLDHTIWTSDYEYWEVSLGYGYTCDEAQRQVIRDWVAALGYKHEPISQ